MAVHSRRLDYPKILLMPHNKSENIYQVKCFLKGRLSEAKPFLEGEVEFFFKRPDLYRPKALYWFEKGKRQRGPIDEIFEVFKRTRKIYYHNLLLEESNNPLLGYLKDFQFDNKLEAIDLCPHCLTYPRYTELKRRFTVSYLDKEACRTCALEELITELKAKGVILSSEVEKYVLRVLDKTQNVSKTLRIFDRGVDFLGEHTLVNLTSASDVPKKMFVKDLSINPELIESILSRGIRELLPVQTLAIQKGLLEGKNLLVVASTSAGKTLIGELAGVNAILKQKADRVQQRKLVFCVPLVALANTKYEDFKAFYSRLGLKVALRVGQSRIGSRKSGKGIFRDHGSLENADIIVGSYEALDYALRTNQLKKIGVVIIDEVQMLSDPERGSTLDGLIVRLQAKYKKTQIIGLSATVGNPEQLADALKLELVEFNGRPVPLEQHVILSKSEEEKGRQISKLIWQEWNIKSSNNYRGQTIVFTNSRSKANQISRALFNKRINARMYHAGLTYPSKKKTEEQFAAGRLQAIVATYALGAGVDFACSQVIFESLMMGKSVLSPNEFNQMLGRAGRLGKHDRGKAVLLASPEPVKTSEVSKTELNFAFDLLRAPLTPVLPSYDEDYCAEQLLAFIMPYKALSRDKAKKRYNQLIGAQIDFEEILGTMKKEKFVTETSKGLTLTRIGYATSLSFFKPSEAKSIYKRLEAGGKENSPLTIALDIIPFESVYLTKKMRDYLERKFNRRFGVRLVSSPVLDLLSGEYQEDKHLDKWFLAILVVWAQKIFNCNCKDRPYCDCGLKALNRIIVRQRRKGKTPQQITDYLMEKYSLYSYAGDIYKWLDNLVFVLEGIARITDAIDYDHNIQALIAQIEEPTMLTSKSSKAKK
ncbi:MAG: DEAD/DEAH box helicase [Promethearchaeota archaeon]